VQFYVWNCQLDILSYIICLFVKRIESFLALGVYGDIRGTWTWKWDIKANTKAMQLSHHVTPIKVLDVLYEPLYHFPRSLNSSFPPNFTLFLKFKREMKESVIQPRKMVQRKRDILTNSLNTCLIASLVPNSLASKLLLMWTSAYQSSNSIFHQ
jgi:hypothetical protein